MRALPVISLAFLALAACGERAEAPASSPAGQAPADAAAGVTATRTPVVLSAAQLPQVCRAALAAIHGQALTAVQIDGVEGQIVSAAWRAPVDGGVARGQCRIEGDRAFWKPVGSTNPEQDRWMNQSGDPVTRFALEGGQITITTTLPDGTTATEQYAVADQEEAR